MRRQLVRGIGYLGFLAAFLVPFILTFRPMGSLLAYIFPHACHRMIQFCVIGNVLGVLVFCSWAAWLAGALIVLIAWGPSRWDLERFQDDAAVDPRRMRRWIVALATFAAIYALWTAYQNTLEFKFVPYTRYYSRHFKYFVAGGALLVYIAAEALRWYRAKSKPA